MVVMPPCLPSLSPVMISILGCSCLPLHNLHCLSSLSPFMISFLGCSWLTSLVSQTCLPGKFANFGNLRGIMLSGVYAGVIFIRENSTGPTVNCLGNYTNIAQTVFKHEIACAPTLFTNQKTDVGKYLKRMQDASSEAQRKVV